VQLGGIIILFNVLRIWQGPFTPWRPTNGSVCGRLRHSPIVSLISHGSHGNEKVVSFGSKALCPAQSHYTTGETDGSETSGGAEPEGLNEVLSEGRKLDVPDWLKVELLEERKLTLPEGSKLMPEELIIKSES
jgi:hypothetical protein